jgi:uncharacterized membrane protein YdjX (TVP38/TMEM64 family)
MRLKLYSWRYKILVFCILGVIAFIGSRYRGVISELTNSFYDLLTDRDQITSFITSFGALAPLVFVVVQIFQVIFAPFPGEATGFVGGYLFGTLAGFIYSSIGLTLGSVINFLIGRLLGRRYIRKRVPVRYLEKFDGFVKQQGLLVLLVLFIFPGFPKDYLCLFLGLSTLPLKVLTLLAAFGRMPGTFILSLQGASLFEKDYALFGLLLVFCLIVCIIAYRYRENVYQWIEKMNSQK